MKSIIIDYINGFSIPSSFTRGMDYYKSGKVLSVKQKGNKFIAKVQGTEKYKVTLNYTAEYLNFHCSCPYDLDGLCKHCVAVGMEIVHGDYDLESWNDEKKGEAKDYPKIIDKLMKQSSYEEKIDFLRQLLMESEENLNRFETHIKGQLGVEENIDIAEISGQIKEIIEELDITEVNSLHSYSDSGYYQDEWESAYNGLDELLTANLDIHLGKIREYLDRDNIINAWKYLLAGYEAILIIDDYEIDDPYDFLYNGISVELENIWKDKYFRKIKEYLENNKTSAEVNLRLIEIFTDRIKLSFKDLIYNLRLFFPVILKLITNREIASFLQEKLQETGYDSNADEIILKITKILEDDKQWERKALKYYQSNPKISQALLNYYQENQAVDKYKKVVRNIFNRFPDKFDSQIYSYLKDLEETKFLEQVLKHYLIRTGNIKLYRELKQKFGREVAQDFIREIGKKRKDTRFYVRLLEEEKRFEEILKILKDQIDYPNLDYLIKPIINVYPEQCLSLLKKKVSKFLVNNTGRKNYRESIHWLHLMNSVKKTRYKKEVEEYIRSLLDKYTRRPAFHDEMEKAGLKK
jgi:hypothetical protein